MRHGENEVRLQALRKPMLNKFLLVNPLIGIFLLLFVSRVHSVDIHSLALHGVARVLTDLAYGHAHRGRARRMLTDLKAPFMYSLRLKKVTNL